MKLSGRMRNIMSPIETVPKLCSENQALLTGSPRRMPPGETARVCTPAPVCTLTSQACLAGRGGKLGGATAPYLGSYRGMTSRSATPRNPKHKNSVPTVRDKIRRKRNVDVSPSFENFVVKI